MRIGLIGCGGISGAYLRAARRLDGVDITAVADIDLAAAQDRANEFDIPFVTIDPIEMLKRADIDAVVIAVPPKWHADLFLAGVAAGKHILLEKPLGMTLAEADAILEAGRAGGRVIGASLVHRYLPVYHVVRDLIVAGALGRISQIRLRTGRDIYPDARFSAPDRTRGGWLTRADIAGGGILMSSTIHLISAAAFLLSDARFRSVSSILRQLHPGAFPGIEDDVTLSIEVEGGAELLIEDSWARSWPFEFEILGDRGRIRSTGANWSDSVVMEGHLLGPVPEAYADLGVRSGFEVNAARYANRCRPLFEGLLVDFATQVRNRPASTMLPNLRHARNVHAVVAAAYAAAGAHAQQAVAFVP